MADPQSSGSLSGPCSQESRAAAANPPLAQPEPAGDTKSPGPSRARQGPGSAGVSPAAKGGVPRSRDKLSGTRAQPGVGHSSGHRALAIKGTPAGELVPAAPGSCLLQGLQLPSGRAAAGSGQGQSFLVPSECHESCRIALLIPTACFRAGQGREKLGSGMASL